MSSDDLLPHPLLPPFTRRGLDDVGLTPHGLAALLRAGAVLQPISGVYLDARTTGHDLARARAVALAVGDDAVVTRGLAVWLHGFDPRAPHERDRPLPSSAWPLLVTGYPTGAVSPPTGTACPTPT